MRRIVESPSRRTGELCLTENLRLCPRRGILRASTSLDKAWVSCSGANIDGGVSTRGTLGRGADYHTGVPRALSRACHSGRSLFTANTRLSPYSNSSNGGSVPDVCRLLLHQWCRKHPINFSRQRARTGYELQISCRAEVLNAPTPIICDAVALAQCGGGATKSPQGCWGNTQTYKH